MQDIPLLRLAISFLPAIIVVAVLSAWKLSSGKAIYAIARMVIQLLVVGYLLVFIFETEHPWVVLGVLTFMMAVASWIALQSVEATRGRRYLKALGAIALGGTTTLLFVSQGVLQLEPFWQPQLIIPLAGMIYANAMNCISLSAERYDSERAAGKTYVEARNIALHAALIPITNSMLSVGLVSLPGMMTGQILGGASPLIAVRYQIMVMCMVFGSGGMSAACFLHLLRREDAVLVNIPPATSPSPRDGRS